MVEIKGVVEENLIVDKVEEEPRDDEALENIIEEGWKEFDNCACSYLGEEEDNKKLKPQWKFKIETTEIFLHDKGASSFKKLQRNI